ncbi:hypothetical protein [Nonomuraea sp. NPDC048826]|uniref:hypothetical protein n=1 Tax=Nonomuraea sp. NPDC048826 TaxID=3364347 RepID=UPI00371958CC
MAPASRVGSHATPVIPSARATARSVADAAPAVPATLRLQAAASAVSATAKARNSAPQARPASMRAGGTALSSTTVSYQAASVPSSRALPAAPVVAT